MMFGNECLADYNLFEGTTATIFMVGMFLSFFVEFMAHRHGQDSGHSAATTSTAAMSEKKSRSNVLILEAGIIFHSICEFVSSALKSVVVAFWN